MSPSALRRYLIVRARRLSHRIRTKDPARYRQSLVEIVDAGQQALDDFDAAQHALDNDD